MCMPHVSKCLSEGTEYAATQEESKEFLLFVYKMSQIPNKAPNTSVWMNYIYIEHESCLRQWREKQK